MMQKTSSNFRYNKKFLAATIVTIVLILFSLGPFLSNTIFMNAYAAESYSLIKQWGSFGTENGQFHLPWSLALDSSNNVYVVDRNNDRIQKFDNDGNFITVWNVVEPVGIATDSLNNVYVTAISNGANIAIKFSSMGNLIKSWFVASPNPNVDTQNAIAVDNLNNVYVSSNSHIFKYTSDGTFIKSWGSEGTGDGQFQQIVGIAIDSSNNVYATDAYSQRVEKFDSDGTFIKSWGSDCQGTRVFCSDPQGIGTDSSNNVYVTEYNAGRVSKFTNDGSFITGWDVPSAYGIAIDNLGNVYISSGTNVIQIYSPVLDNIPPYTAITSVLDDNGNPIQNGGSTVSTSITFQVSATPGSNPIAGFECSLDASQFSTCATNTNPGTVSYDNLAAGQQHTFKVRAVDNTGNKDPTHATFTWTIITPQQAVQNIINTIEHMHLPRGTTTSLEAPLNAALSQLNRNNYAAACNTLNAFLNQVKAKENNGQLTSQQAADLRQQATAIETSLGCSSTSTTMTTATNNNGQESTSSIPSASEKQQEQALINLRNLAENDALSSMTK